MPRRIVPPTLALQQDHDPPAAELAFEVRASAQPVDETADDLGAIEQRREAGQESGARAAVREPPADTQKDKDKEEHEALEAEIRIVRNRCDRGQ